MPIKTSWYDDQHRVVLQKFTGDWTWEELGQALKAMQSLPDPADGDWVVLNDMSETRIMPRGNVLMQGKMVFKQSPQNVSNIVFVLDSQMIKTFVRVVFDLMPSWRDRLQIAKTLEEGQRLVEKSIVKLA